MADLPTAPSVRSDVFKAPALRLRRPSFGTKKAPCAAASVGVTPFLFRSSKCISD
jgi:hypothetical protein